MRRSCAVLFVSASISSAPALGAIAGYTEDFNTGLGGWGGGATLELFASGGAGGAGDGYLLVSNNPDQLATRNNSAPYTGDLIADGVTGISFWLNDLGEQDTLRIRVAVGNPGNFWVTSAEFSPGADQWSMFEVDLTDAGAWELLQGAGTFEDALRSTNRVQFRNSPLPGDPAPPDGIAEFGLDRITLVPTPSGLGMMLMLGVVGARRKR